jgi:hypothetical protein
MVRPGFAMFLSLKIENEMFASNKKKYACLTVNISFDALEEVVK